MLSKILLMSVLLAAILIPVHASRDERPVRGLRKAVLYTVAFNFAYLIALRFIYPYL